MRPATKLLFVVVAVTLSVTAVAASVTFFMQPQLFAALFHSAADNDQRSQPQAERAAEVPGGVRTDPPSPSSAAAKVQETFVRLLEHLPPNQQGRSEVLRWIASPVFRAQVADAKLQHQFIDLYRGQGKRTPAFFRVDLHFDYSKGMGRTAGADPWLLLDLFRSLSPDVSIDWAIQSSASPAGFATYERPLDPEATQIHRWPFVRNDNMRVDATIHAIATSVPIDS